MSAVLQQLAKLDLSPLVPKKYRAKAKAVGTLILGAVAVAVQITVIDAATAAWISTAVLTVLGSIGVHQTTNA